MKLINEIDLSCGLLRRLFSEIPEEDVVKLPPGEMHYILYNLLRPSTLNKFRKCGFQALLHYMNLMEKAKGKIEENLYALFTTILPFKLLEDEKVPIQFKDLPMFCESTKTDHWVIIIAKDSQENAEELKINVCIRKVQKIIKNNPTTSVFWFEIMANSWLKYLYPLIYYKIWPIPQAQNIGYHPFCPPFLHVTLNFC